MSSPGWGPAAVAGPGSIPRSNVFIDRLAWLRATVPTGPEPNPQTRFGARAIDLAIEATVTIIVAINGPAGRRLASGLIAFALVTAYETILVATAGGTLGKRALGLRIVPVDHEGAVPWDRAFKRGAAIGAVALTSFVSPGLGIGLGAYFGVSIAMSAHYRAGHDRVSGTYVLISDRRPKVVTSEALQRWIDPRHTRVWSSLGLVATLDQRRRARAQRLERAPILLAWLVGSSLLMVTVWQTLVAFIWLTVAWIVVFTIDETIRIHKRGTTHGHREYGLVVVDRRTGRPPGWVRATLRSFVLGLFMFTPLLPILALWVKVADEGRGPHDLIGRTAVIAHPALSERFARWPVAPTAPQFAF